MTRRPILAAALLTIAVAAFSRPASGYSVLTHEAVIDSLWDTSIRKLLLKRFPGATAQDLDKAHAFAYGGCIIQDMGYYPFGNHFFTDLTHYVRSGDFIVALIRESQNLDEYAFAIGAMAHYASDNNGHRLGTNPSVPVLYPKLGRRFGKTVTYWDHPISHIRTEFAFDVLQVAVGRYDPDRYQAFLGFEVSKPVMERAFLATYGLELKDLFTNLDLALGTFRFSVGTVIPGMTKVAWELKHDSLEKENPGLTREKFLFHFTRANYENHWGKEYQRPGFPTRLLACVIRIIPKVGPFRILAFRPPTPEVEKMFVDSFRATVDMYSKLLAALDAGSLQLPNENFDLGSPTQAGQYEGADLTYDKLLGKLADRKFAGVPPALRKDMLDYYRARPQEGSQKDWAKLMEQRAQLERADTAGAAGP